MGIMDGWISTVGEVHVRSKKPLADSSPICRHITGCAMTWTATSSVGTLASSHGESFDVMVKISRPATYMTLATVARAKPCRMSMIRYMKDYIPCVLRRSRPHWRLDSQVEGGKILFLT